MTISTVSTVSTEQVFDMLPHASDIYTNLNIKNYLKNNVFTAKKGENAENSKKLAGADLIAYILKNSPKAKEAFFNIVAIFEGKSIEEVKKQSLFKTMATIKAIMNDKDLLDFFKASV